MSSLGLQIREPQAPSPKVGHAVPPSAVSISVILLAIQTATWRQPFPQEGTPPSHPPVLSILALPAKSPWRGPVRATHQPPHPSLCQDHHLLRCRPLQAPKDGFPGSASSWRIACWSASIARGLLTAPAQVCQRHKRNHTIFYLLKFSGFSRANMNLSLVPKQSLKSLGIVQGG